MTAVLSGFGDVAQVFDYRAGRLDDAADGPGQGKAGLDRDPLARRGITAGPQLHHVGAALAGQPAGGQHHGPGRHESARARGKAIGGAAVTDHAMLAVALHLRSQELSLRDIAARLVISTGKKKGQHPSPATVMRMLREHDEKAAATDVNLIVR